MNECVDCKKIEVCKACGEKICMIHESKIKVCKIVGYYNDSGDLVCEQCHRN